MFDFNGFDVAVGLLVVYLILSLVCTAGIEADDLLACRAVEVPCSASRTCGSLASARAIASGV